MSSVLVSKLESSNEPIERIFSRSMLVRIGWRTSRRFFFELPLWSRMFGLGPMNDTEAHHELLADRVDRRVRDLREVLLEVGVEQLRLRRERRDRRVGAHRADRLGAGHRHRLHQKVEVFLRVAEGLLAIEQRDVAAGDARLDGAEFLQHELGAVDPLAVGVQAADLLLDLRVGDDTALLEVDQQHLARLQAPLGDDLLLGNRQHAGFRGHHDEPVVGDEVARRAQAVAVERGADLAAVGEGHGGGAVPRLHHGGVILVEGAALLVHERVAGPGLGDEHHHGMGQRVAASGPGIRARCRSTPCRTGPRRRSARAW